MDNNFLFPFFFFLVVVVECLVLCFFFFLYISYSSALLLLLLLLLLLSLAIFVAQRQRVHLGAEAVHAALDEHLSLARVHHDGGYPLAVVLLLQPRLAEGFDVAVLVEGDGHMHLVLLRVVVVGPLLLFLVDNAEEKAVVLLKTLRYVITLEGGLTVEVRHVRVLRRSAAAHY